MQYLSSVECVRLRVCRLAFRGNVTELGGNL